MLQAATRIKFAGTLSTLTLAPALCGLRPVMGKFLSCMAVRMNLCRFPRWAKDIDHKERALTLKLRELGGLIRAAGDICVSEYFLLNL